MYSIFFEFQRIVSDGNNHLWSKKKTQESLHDGVEPIKKESLYKCLSYIFSLTTSSPAEWLNKKKWSETIASLAAFFYRLNDDYFSMNPWLVWTI